MHVEGYVLLLLIYVDDVVLLAKNKDGLQKILDSLKKNFK
jgi:hypothetical protein